MRPLARTNQRKKISLICILFFFHHWFGIAYSVFHIPRHSCPSKACMQWLFPWAMLSINSAEASQDLSLHLFKVQIFHGIFIHDILKTGLHVSNIFWNLDQVLGELKKYSDFSEELQACVHVCVHVNCVSITERVTKLWSAELPWLTPSWIWELA